MKRVQHGPESRPSVHSMCDTGPMVQLVMGPMRVSVEHEQSQRLTHVMQVVSATCGSGSALNGK